MECSHSNQHLIEIDSELFICSYCSSLILLSKIDEGELTPKKIALVKSKNIKTRKQNNTLILFKEDSNRNCYSFLNKKEYLQYRKPIIKQMKQIIKNYNLSIQTFFLSIEYLDYISSKMNSFNNETLFPISMFCIILAAKFIENSTKVYQIQSLLKNSISRNYIIDEIYILKLLNHDLHKFTSYDILMEINDYGFIFEDEIFNQKKLDFITNEMSNILYIFSENNSFIDLNPKHIVISIIGLARELLRLEPFPERIKIIFSRKNKPDKYFSNGLEKLKKFFKVNTGDKINEANDNNSELQ